MDIVTFKQRYVNDEIGKDDLQAYVLEWHMQDCPVSLRTFLGFTEEEYLLFHKGGDLFEKVLDSKFEYHPNYAIAYMDHEVIRLKPLEGYDWVNATMIQMIDEEYEKVTAIVYDGEPEATWNFVESHRLYGR